MINNLFYLSRLFVRLVKYRNIALVKLINSKHYGLIRTRIPNSNSKHAVIEIRTHFKYPRSKQNINYLCQIIIFRISVSRYNIFYFLSSYIWRALFQLASRVERSEKKRAVKLWDTIYRLSTHTFFFQTD